MDNDSLILSVNGEAYEGWEEVHIKRSMETVCSEYSLTASNRWEQKGKPVPIREQDEVVLKIGDDLLLTGFIDSVSPDTVDRRNIKVEGRDKTCDLVDCSNYLKKVDYFKMTFFDLANIFCSPFNINVSVLTNLSGEKYPKFSIETGETVFQTLNRLAAKEGVMLGSDENGNLTIFTKGSDRAAVALQAGVNIKTHSGKFDITNRFSKYILRGQDAGNGVEGWGNSKAQIEAVAEDPGIARYRPLIVHAESNITPSLAKRRANYEMTIRRARSLAVDVSVQGWRQKPSGPLWQTNQIVSVTIPELELIGQDLLIGEFSFTKSDAGTETQLHLVPEDSYLQEPKKKKPGKKEKTRWH